MEYNVFQNNKILDIVRDKKWAKLYNILDLFCDDTKSASKIKKEEYLGNGKYPIVDQGQLYIAGYSNNDEELYQEVPTILFGDHTRVLKYIDFPLFIGADGVKLLKLKNNDKSINVKFVYYFLKTVELPSDGYSRHFKYLKQVVVPIPNRNIQDNIVSTLDKALELIDKRKEQIQALDELVKSRFIEMFGDVFLNTKNFKMKQIKEIVTVVKGITYKPEQVNEEGTIVLRSSNVKGSTFDLKDIVRVNKKIDEKFLVKVNDILMCNRNGSERLVGKVAKIPEYNEPMTFGTFMTIVRSPYYNYLFSFFQTEAFRRQIKMQTSVAINQISIPLLESVKVPLPPIELQNEFAEFVKQVDKLKFEMENSLKELEGNFNSLMQRAFKGNLFN